LSLAGVVLAIVLFVPSATTARASFDALVVFGTSLSDPGNAFALTHTTSTPPYETLDTLLVPSAPYATGGQHFSNGATWIEQLARALRLAGSARPAFQGAGRRGTNYAIGGTRARDDGFNASLGLQVAAFLADSNGAAPAEALYVIEMGGNDVRDALVAFLLGGSGNAVVTDAVAAIRDSIVALHAAGARRFLVWNSPNIALTPAVAALDTLVPGSAALAALFTAFFNANLQATLSGLAALPGIEIKDFDAFQTLSAFVAAPGSFGLTVVDFPCIMPGVAPFHCPVPDAYLFWDGIHPTAAGHGLLAEAAAVRLAQP
jgi:outer membrane lipase/esterase